MHERGPRRDQDRQPLSGDDHGRACNARTKAAARSTATSPGTRSTTCKPISTVMIPKGTTPVDASAISGTQRVSANTTGSGPTNSGTNAGSAERSKEKFGGGEVGNSSAGSQKTLARKGPPIRKLVGNHPMPPGDIHNPRFRLETLSHNPRLQIIRPAPVPAPRFDNLATPNKSIPTVNRHLHLITKTFWQTRQATDTGEINGSETPHTERIKHGGPSCCSGPCQGNVFAREGRYRRVQDRTLIAKHPFSVFTQAPV